MERPTYESLIYKSLAMINRQQRSLIFHLNSIYSHFNKFHKNAFRLSPQWHRFVRRRLNTMAREEKLDKLALNNFRINSETKRHGQNIPTNHGHSMIRIDSGIQNHHAIQDNYGIQGDRFILTPPSESCFQYKKNSVNQSVDVNTLSGKHRRVRRISWIRGSRLCSFKRAGKLGSQVSETQIKQILGKVGREVGIAAR